MINFNNQGRKICRRVSLALLLLFSPFVSQCCRVKKDKYLKNSSKMLFLQHFHRILQHKMIMNFNNKGRKFCRRVSLAFLLPFWPFMSQCCRGKNRNTSQTDQKCYFYSFSTAFYSIKWYQISTIKVENFVGEWLWPFWSLFDPL